MKTVLLISTVAAIFIFVYFIMKKLDIFLENNRESSKEDLLNVAFETPVLIDFISDLLEDFSGKNQNYKFCLFFGTVNDIEKSLAANKVDFAFLTTDFECSNGKEYSSAAISLKQRTVISSSAGLRVSPLGEEEIMTRVVWKEDSNDLKKNLFIGQLNRFLQYGYKEV